MLICMLMLVIVVGWMCCVIGLWFCRWWLMFLWLCLVCCWVRLCIGLVLGGWCFIVILRVGMCWFGLFVRRCWFRLLLCLSRWIWVDVWLGMVFGLLWMFLFCLVCGFRFCLLSKWMLFLIFVLFVMRCLRCCGSCSCVVLWLVSLIGLLICDGWLWCLLVCWWVWCEWW